MVVPADIVVCDPCGDPRSDARAEAVDSGDAYAGASPRDKSDDDDGMLASALAAAAAAPRPAAPAPAVIIIDSDDDMGCPPPQPACARRRELAVPATLRGASYGESGGPLASPRSAGPEINLLRAGAIRGTTYGESSYKLYQASSNGPKINEKTLLVLWLHAGDMGDIPTVDLLKVHLQLERRTTCFLVPRSPKAPPGGLKFEWGLSYTKAQGRNSWSFIFGQLDDAYLHALCALVRAARIEVGASEVWVIGYSMGGFGAYQVASHDPDAFDAIVPVAGYALGTIEPSNSGYYAPQPESSEIFKGFLDKYAARLARVRVLAVVHAERDAESSYRDARAIVKRVRREGGNVMLIRVPDVLADSDPGKKGALRGHRYFNYALLSDTSRSVLYDRLQEALAATSQPKPGELPSNIKAKPKLGPPMTSVPPTATKSAARSSPACLPSQPPQEIAAERNPIRVEAAMLYVPDVRGGVATPRKVAELSDMLAVSPPPQRPSTAGLGAIAQATQAAQVVGAAHEMAVPSKAHPMRRRRHLESGTGAADAPASKVARAGEPSASEARVGFSEPLYALIAGAS